MVIGRDRSVPSMTRVAWLAPKLKPGGRAMRIACVKGVGDQVSRTWVVNGSVVLMTWLLENAWEAHPSTRDPPSFGLASKRLENFYSVVADALSVVFCAGSAASLGPRTGGAPGTGIESLAH
jgi:hypothetical protein